MEAVVRSEQDIFNDLATLCVSAGYAHAIAYFCFRDHVVGYSDALEGADYAKLFSFERLIRTEISTLIGLMVRAPRDLTTPDIKTLESYIARTETLLRELHDALNEPVKTELQKAFADPDRNNEFNPFANAAALREPIFYGAESAYSFQYRDLSVEKYARDKEWLRKQKGFTPEDARRVVAALCEFLNDKLLETLKGMKGLPLEKWSVLNGFQFTVTDITAKSGLPEATVKAAIDAFTCPEDGNSAFTSLNDFNAANAFPILKVDGDNHILLLYVSLTEALYETPFYWMNGDKAYAAAAMTNRGVFTEEFCAARLERVFGPNRTFRNVDIWENSARKKKLGEIDALVLIGDRAVVVQAKSKKLTLAARKGNDLQLQSDFKAAVQDACDQAITCSKYLLTGASVLADSSGKEINPTYTLKTAHPVCVVSDHYPALTFQAQQLLTFNPTDKIKQPLVCDVFFIDVVTEFLETPLRLLSYLELRARAASNISLSHEIVALGYHLRQNLWLGDYNFMALDDDISVDVDIAMAARRDGVNGEKNPRGILTYFKGTAIGRIIEDIEKRSEPGAIAAGLELLKLSGKSANDLSRMVEKITVDATREGKPHDATMAIGEAGSGVTVHCNALPEKVAGPKLKRHCELRKYGTRANIWFGLAIRPLDGAVRFGLTLDYPWKQQADFDAAVAKMPAPTPIKAIRKILNGKRQEKTGRNDPCPCRSGLKYKNCHLPKGGFH
ncbi:SEC-C domain-containing protein [Methylosinus sp. H3A]|uniref:YecA family protein n=1 Tax=Methylosinus sp. H3A TaxID=2785786 RepID=UPI0018C1FC13|nr:SEC-C domain-containing protein [Methylosinus sp. H3A]MBG0811144.1 SEC-C domain-containing protein [Methylosinus sp. H3A]